MKQDYALLRNINYRSKLPLDGANVISFFNLFLISAVFCFVFSFKTNEVIIIVVVVINNTSNKHVNTTTTNYKNTKLRFDLF